METEPALATRTPFSRLLRLTEKALRYWRSPAATGLVVLAIAVGVGSGYGAVLFRWLVSTVQYLFFAGARSAFPWMGRYYVILVPAAGGLVVGPLIYFLGRRESGHGVPEIMLAAAHQGGRMRTRVPLIKALAAAVCIGSGGSAGLHGPVVQIGSAIGSALGQALKLPSERVRLLLACGAAGGIAATFNAPIGGGLFALEVILREFTTRSFGIVVISSVSAVVISHIYLGDAPAFLAPPYSLVSAWEIPLYLLLGIAAAFVARAFIWGLYATTDLFERWSIPSYLKPAVGGLLVGTLGVQIPQVFGVGYESIDLALAGAVGLSLLGSLVALKLVATSLTLGSGGSGGVFAPSLFIGAMLGGTLGHLFHALWPTATATTGAYALVGMAAVFAATARAPMTAIIILYELTADYRIIGPLMIATVVSTLLSERLSRESIYTLKLARRGVDVLGAEPDVLDTIPVAEAMSRDFPSVPSEVPADELLQLLVESGVHSLPVVDEEGMLVGIVSRSDIEEAVLHKRAHASAGDIMTPDPVSCYGDESLTLALHRLTSRDVSALPVLDPAQGMRTVGMLSRRDIIEGYRNARRQRPEFAERIERLSGSVPEARVFEVMIGRESAAAGQLVRSLSLPSDSILVAVRRGNRTLIPRGDTMLESGDRVVALASPAHFEELRRSLAGRPDSR